MINTVVFDIGNVLMGFDWMTYVRRLFHEDSLVIEKVNDAVWTSGLWNELDRGVMTEDDILNGFFLRQPAYKNEIQTAYDHVGQCLFHYDYSIPWIQELKAAGYGVLYLSNYSTHVMKANPDVLDFLPYMDGGIFSCNVKLVKPDHAIYRKLTEDYHLIPEKCIFIDDTEANVKAAAECGFHALQFTGYEEAHAVINPKNLKQIS